MSEFLSIEQFKELNDSIPKYLREQVTGNEDVDGKEVNRDPDSSKRAWDHYGKRYGDKLDMSNLQFERSGTRYLTHILIKEKSIQLGGDCDFNFSEEKLFTSSDNFTCYKKLIEYSNADQEQKDRVEAKLAICNNNHHTFINFSLMPVTGGLNNVKQSLDHYDGIVRALNRVKKFYDSGTNVSNLAQHELLHKHLKEIGTFENYLELYYFKEAKDILEYFPVSKSHPQNRSRKNLNNLEKHLDMVMTYWNKKSEYLVNTIPSN